ncbi:MAG: acetoacetate--CoA ligase [Gemmatimonadaceae bacterium]|nr:acetoacetate--CoA ligase [Gemmatimonadaceae bacterium]
MSRTGDVIWTPSAAQQERAAITAFGRALPELLAGTGHASPALPAGDIDALQRWSVAHRAAFWTAWWRRCDLLADSVTDAPPWAHAGIGLDRMAPPTAQDGPRWFPDARLNVAEHLLRGAPDQDALISWDERGPRGRLSRGALQREVARVADGLRAAGLSAGDRVAGFVPNGPHAVIAMLAAASLGAVWSSCSPDFGTRGVLDRFSQIAPTVLFACDGYRYAGKEIDTRARVAEIVSALPSVQAVVMVPWLQDAPDLSAIPRAVPWDAFGDAAAPLAFTRLPFDHPLYILYSSGTTGLPKAIVHGAGGTLLQHLKELVLHTDLRAEDRLFYFTTCGWMMWNWMVSALAVGAAIVTYDGAPLAPEPDILWRLAATERVAVFGTSAKYLALAEKEGLTPRRTHDLAALRTICSTGSPLAEHSYDYVLRDVHPGVCLSSISGGTDIVSCFALGNPAGVVRRGELQMLGLGMAVDVWDADGQPLRDAAGELVCTKPFPSMPVGFWNDADGAKYRSAYFEHFPGVWRHGDWATRPSHGGLIIHGRSDATLNPGGVRIGTAEIYRVVEQHPDIVESLVVGQDVLQDGERDVRIVLFVRLREGRTLDDALRDAIKRDIRAHASPHHVPKVIVAVTDIPRTRSGKITELAVRDIIHGRWPKNTEALANPEALEQFRHRPELALTDATAPVSQPS